jgi:DNA-binding transcriptional MerR regulator
MRIGELAAETGVSVRALRYYEEQQLLSSERTPSGQRVYPAAALKTILELLPCVDSGVSTPESAALLTLERDRINQQIISLIATRDRLDAVIAIAADTTHPCATRVHAAA